MIATYFECECHASEHRLVVTHDPEYDRPELHIETYLNNFYPWYKRMWIGLKYILGHKCKYGVFDETILGAEEIAQLKNICNDILCNYAGKKY